MKLKFSEIINLNSLSPQTEFEEKVVSFLEDWFQIPKWFLYKHPVQQENQNF
jgi:hypothetical protein